jgi:hypothetical protein
MSRLSHFYCRGEERGGGGFTCFPAAGRLSHQVRNLGGREGCQLRKWVQSGAMVKSADAAYHLTSCGLTLALVVGGGSMSMFQSHILMKSICRSKRWNCRAAAAGTVERGRCVWFSKYEEVIHSEAFRGRAGTANPLLRDSLKESLYVRIAYNFMQHQIVI